MDIFKAFVLMISDGSKSQEGTSQMRGAVGRFAPINDHGGAGGATGGDSNRSSVVDAGRRMPTAALQAAISEYSIAAEARESASAMLEGKKALGREQVSIDARRATAKERGNETSVRAPREPVIEQSGVKHALSSSNRITARINVPHDEVGIVLGA